MPRMSIKMPTCAECGIYCSGEISFNWNDGIRYLCSKECVEESRVWRLRGGD